MDDVSTLTVTLVAAAAVGQVTFVTMWARMPWQREWIGRALMAKSAALAAYLVFVLAVLVVPEQYAAVVEAVSILLFLAILVGIWLQVYALAREIRRARKQNRRV